MEKRPSFQFYPADWLSNSNLNRCSYAAQGIWMKVLCLLHDSSEYGVLRWSLDDIAMAIGCPAKFLKELAQKGVLKGVESGTCDPFIYTPIHGRISGEPITLIEETNGPIWYSSRMVRDEYKRRVRGESSRFKASPKGGIGDDKGDGSSSSSSSSENNKYKKEKSVNTNPEFESFFNALWDSYPKRNGRKVGKPEAHRKAAMVQTEDRAFLLRAIKNYAASTSLPMDAHRFIKNGKGDDPWREYVDPSESTKATGLATEPGGRQRKMLGIVP